MITQNSAFSAKVFYCDFCNINCSKKMTTIGIF